MSAYLAMTILGLATIRAVKSVRVPLYAPGAQLGGTINQMDLVANVHRIALNVKTV